MIARYQWRLGESNVNAVEGDEQVHSLFVDRNNKVFLAK